MAKFEITRSLDENAVTLRQACEQIRLDPEAPSEADLLFENYSYLRSSIRELQQAFSPGFCRKLAKRNDFQIVGIVEHALANISGRLTPSALTRAFTAAQLNRDLSLSELWAIPPLSKFVLIGQICSLIASRSWNALDDAILRLRSLERIRWSPLIESISVVERTLSLDPCGVYPGMEFEARDSYRHVVEEIAESSKCNEEEVARAVVDLAGAASSRNSLKEPWQAEALAPPQTHVGYYLIGDGLSELLKSTSLRLSPISRVRRFLLKTPTLVYLGGVVCITALLSLVFYSLLAPLPAWVAILLPLPLSQTAVALVNLAVTLFFKPTQLPRLDFSKGIPEEFRSFVVIPTLLLSKAGVERLVERLEIHYLANRDPNLLFALLTDGPDSKSETAENDSLVEYCASRIQKLNQTHGGTGRPPFYLFHRPRTWNAGEEVWMARERKRGKLEDFNRYLLGISNEFSVITGETSNIGAIRFVITLDSDTQLPRDTAWKLIGSLAHPLNRAVIDPRTHLVREGYAILQPRVSVSMESAGRSRLARVYSGQTGLDPYSRAISDVYQDLFHRATFTGKGIYDVRAFHETIDGRFPENTLLSHDLIEGEHAGVGLVSDVVVIDDYPATYEAYSKRKHRWIRGDWQILYWLLSRVPRADGRWAANHLSLLSRWKIVDNLRRSLFECSLLVLLLTIWLLLPSAAARVTLAAAGMLLIPSYVDALISMVRLPPVRFWKSYFRERAAQLLRVHVETVLSLVFLLHQAILSADAVVRTLIRRFVTHKRLLEWESMAQSEEQSGNGPSLVQNYALSCVIIGLILVAMLTSFHSVCVIGLIAAMLWAATPLTAKFVNMHPISIRQNNPNDVEFLRDVALSTWRYFRDFSHADHHWLVPDNIQQQPYAVARRTSPTNFGLQMTANLAAFDFGYLTPIELAKNGKDLCDTLCAMERERGHFYNWYDTRTLEPLPPRYISTVDSGNLNAALIAFRQGCEEILQGPVIGTNLLDGLRDHCVRLRNTLPASAKSLSMMRALSAMIRQLESRPEDLFFWEGVLNEVASMMRGLDRHIDWACEHLESRSTDAVREIRYWQSALQERISSALDSLRTFAPWLAAPLVLDLRACANDPAFRNLMNAVSVIPRVGELPHVYDGIRNEIARISRPGLRPSQRKLLLGLEASITSARVPAGSLITALVRLSRNLGGLVHEMDFRFLLDPASSLLRTGYNVAEKTLDESAYDLLASEARTAVFLAIAKGDAPRQSWFRLGRKITSFQGHNTLISWSGTMFEYLMPALFTKTFEPTLLAESVRSVVKIQQLYAGQFGIPWGISEAAHSERDGADIYQYHAFGVPTVSLKGSSKDDLVVAPYATMLALIADREGATENLRNMASRGWMGRYGFYESVDFRRSIFTAQNRAVIVRSFMAHHQAMGLLALCNVLCDNPMQRRFHSERMVAATELLLQERVPALVAIDEEDILYPREEAATAYLSELSQSVSAG